MTLHIRTTHPPETIADHQRWLEHHSKKCAQVTCQAGDHKPGTLEYLNVRRMARFHLFRARYHANAIAVAMGS